MPGANKVIFKLSTGNGEFVEITLRKSGRFMRDEINDVQLTKKQKKRKYKKQKHKKNEKTEKKTKTNNKTTKKQRGN